MVAMHVHCEVNNEFIKTVNDFFQTAVIDLLDVHELVLVDLFILAHVESKLLNKSLDCSCSVDTERDVNNLVNDGVDEGGKDDWISSFEDLLTEIVTELVNDDFWKQWKDLAGEALVEGVVLNLEFIFFWVLNLLLEHSAADLVEAVIVEVANDHSILLA